MSASNPFPHRPILVVDDEEQFLYSAGLSLRSRGITHVRSARGGRQALDMVAETAFSVIILDINLPDISGIDVLERISEISPQTPVVMITAINDAQIAVECMKRGALDYLVKPVDEDKMHTVIRNAVTHYELSGENEALKKYLLGSDLEHPEAFCAIVTNNNRMRALFQYVEAIASTPFPVLITGETGAGKELFARAIHDLSRRSGEFVAVNVAGIDDNTFSDTLFGHVRGAFTGAERPRTGLIEQAARGTLFLDEIGDLSHSSQIKLLRVIQNRDYLPLGADVARIADVRIVVATNRGIDDLKEEGRFRSDLFHRLRTHHIAVLPLRERRDDLLLLGEFFLEEACAIPHKPKPSLPREFAAIFSGYDFPGNVRELRSIVFDAVSVNRSRVLPPGLFRDRIGAADAAAPILPGTTSKDDERGLRFDSRLPTIRQTVTLLIEEALIRSGGNQNVAARLLGISPQALSRRLKHQRANPG